MADKRKVGTGILQGQHSVISLSFSVSTALEFWQVYRVIFFEELPSGKVYEAGRKYLGF